MLIYFLAALESDDDRRRFTQLYDTQYEHMKKTAFSILKNTHDAEDAVHNAFIQIIRHFEKTSEIPCNELPFWIISIVKNEALMILRKKKREYTLPVEDWDSFSEAALESASNYTALVELFTRLPDTYRLALELSVLQGYSSKEIARKLGISETAARTRISRGRELLRKLAEKEGFQA